MFFDSFLFTWIGIYCKTGNSAGTKYWVGTSADSVAVVVGIDQVLFMLPELLLDLNRLLLLVVLVKSLLLLMDLVLYHLHRQFFLISSHLLRNQMLLLENVLLWRSNNHARRYS